MLRQLETEVIDSAPEACAYAHADGFAQFAHDTTARLLELVGDPPHQRMIDLGAGPAAIARQIALLRPTWRITAVDASKRMVLYAQVGINMAHLAERIDVVHADAKSTGLQSGSFDIVFCSNVLHHMPNPAPLWREIKRLAAPGALIYIRDLRRPDTDHAAQQIVQRDASGNPAVFQEGFLQSLRAAFRVDEVRQQLQSAGLAFLQARPIDQYQLEVFGFLPLALRAND